MRWERVLRGIDAVQLVADLYGSDGVVIAKRGEWLITEGHEQFFLSDDEFKKEFRPKSDQAPVMLPYISTPQPSYPDPNGTQWIAPYFGPRCGSSDNVEVGQLILDRETHEVHMPGTSPCRPGCKIQVNVRDGDGMAGCEAW